MKNPTAEEKIMQLITHENGETFMNYIQKHLDFAIENMADCDEDMIYDVIPATNHLLKLLRAYNKNVKST